MPIKSGLVSPSQAAALEARIARLERAANLRVVTPLRLHDLAGGKVLSSDELPDEGFWAKVTLAGSGSGSGSATGSTGGSASSSGSGSGSGSGGVPLRAYSWVEYDLVYDTNLTARAVPVDGGRTGSVRDAPAFELNNFSVDGLIVRLYRGPARQVANYWGSGSGSGSGMSGGGYGGSGSGSGWGGGGAATFRTVQTYIIVPVGIPYPTGPCRKLAVRAYCLNGDIWNETVNYRTGPGNVMFLADDSCGGSGSGSGSGSGGG